MVPVVLETVTNFEAPKAATRQLEDDGKDRVVQDIPSEDVAAVAVDWPMATKLLFPYAKKVNPEGTVLEVQSMPLVDVAATVPPATAVKIPFPYATPAQTWEDGIVLWVHEIPSGEVAELVVAPPAPEAPVITKAPFP